MSAITRRYIPQIIVIAITIPILFQYFLDQPTLDTVTSTIQNYAVIIAAFTMVVISVSMVVWNVTRIRNKSTDWLLSIYFLALFTLTTVLGLTEGLSGANYVHLINLHDNIEYSRMALLLFSMSYIIYRVYRPNNWDNLVLFVCGVLILIGGTSLGESIWPGFAPLRVWLLDVLNTAGQSALVLGVGIGEVLIGVRMLLGTESTFLRRMRRESVEV
jgi:hypothetical protein